LLRVHAPQRVEISVSVFANEHRYVNCGEAYFEAWLFKN
jgi:hypothetical protein